MEFWKNLWGNITTFFTQNAWNIVLFTAVLVLGFIIIKIIVRIVKKLFYRTKLERTLCNFLIGIIKFLLLLIYLMTLLTMIGIPVTSLIAIFTALSLAVALAVQSFLSSLAYGIILIAGKLFKEGDYVEIDSAAGTVTNVNMLNTVLKTPNGQIVSIPHNKTSSAIITNFTKEGSRRLDITLHVAFGSDIEKVKSVLQSVMDRQTTILSDKPKVIALKEFSESALQFAFRAFTNVDDYFQTLYTVNEQILIAFRENQIVIPYNTIDVNIKK